MEPHQFQEIQFSFPYHYLPIMTARGFRQHRYWSWGYRYLGRLEVVFELMRGIEFNSLLDIGCGDGRFLRETRALYKNEKLAGIDTSEKAISLAKQLNPELKFERHDIIDSPLNSEWDVITLLEVLEHIPEENLMKFVKEMVKLLKPGGFLIITVPHLNEKLTVKHYQHFDIWKLRNLFSHDFEEHRVVLFDYISPFLKALLILMGGSGRFFIITHQAFNNLLYSYYRKNCLYGVGTKRCKRIAYLGRRKPF